MAGADKYAKWIVDNPDKKGTPEFETVRKAYQAAKISEQQAIKKGGMSQQFNELADIGVGALGEAAKLAGRIIPGVTGEELQTKTVSALTPKGYQLSPEATQAGQFLTDVGASYALPIGAAGVVSKIPAIAKAAPAVSSAGADLGALKTGSTLVNIGMRTGIGAATGGATAGLINPEEIGTGAAIGGVLGNVPAALGYITDRGSRQLMQKAIKPLPADLESGKAQKAITTMLEEGVNPTPERTIFGRGINTLQEKVGVLNNDIANAIQGSSATIKKSEVLSYLDDLKSKAQFSLDPSDVKAVDKVRTQINRHPLIKGEDIPVQLAQKLKQTTYKSLGEKAFGEMKGAETEAYKAGARGLKEGIAKVEPGVAALNAEEKKLLDTLDVVERRAWVNINSNPVSLGMLAENPVAAAAFVADKSAPFKALLARALYQTGKLFPQQTQRGLLNVPAGIAAGEQ